MCTILNKIIDAICPRSIGFHLKLQIEINTEISDKNLIICFVLIKYPLQDIAELKNNLYFVFPCFSYFIRLISLVQNKIDNS